MNKGCNEDEVTQIMLRLEKYEQRANEQIKELAKYMAEQYEPVNR
jgi:predicted RNA-binding protein Jag